MNATVNHANMLFSKLIPDAAARHNGVQQGGRMGARRGVNIRCILATRSSATKQSGRCMRPRNQG